MTLTEPQIGAFVLVFLRASALALTAPVVGDTGVPARAKLVFVVGIALALAGTRGGVTYGELPVAGALELATGAITGLTARFILARAAVAGQLMGLALGLGFAAEYDAHAGESAGILRTLASTLASLAFVFCGGLPAIVEACIAPPDALALAGAGSHLIVEGAAAFGHGLALAAPILLAALVGNVGVAVMNRAAPAVNVFSIALGAVLVLGAVVLFATAGHFVTQVTSLAGEAAHTLAP